MQPGRRLWPSLVVVIAIGMLNLLKITRLESIERFFNLNGNAKIEIEADLAFKLYKTENKRQWVISSKPHIIHTVK